SGPRAEIDLVEGVHNRDVETVIARERIRGLPGALERARNHRGQRQVAHAGDQPRDLTAPVVGEIGAGHSAGEMMIDRRGVAVAYQVEARQVRSSCSATLSAWPRRPA